MFEEKRERFLSKPLAELINNALENGELITYQDKMTFISKTSSQSLISNRTGITFSSDREYLDFMEVVLYGLSYTLDLIYINVMKRFGGEEFLTERLDENGNVVKDSKGNVIYDSDICSNATGFSKAELKNIPPEYQNEGFFVTSEELKAYTKTEEILDEQSTPNDLSHSMAKIIVNTQSSLNESERTRKPNNMLSVK